MTSTVSEFLIDKWRQGFRFLDVNNDGKLTREDFTLLADNIARETKASEETRQMLRDQWLKYFRVLQPDPSIIIDEERYVTVAMELYHNVEEMKRMNRDTASSTFDLIDLNKNGFISLKEFEVFYKAFGRTNMVAMLERFKKLDRDGDGYIKREEFIDDHVRFYTDPDPVTGQAYLFKMPE